MDSCASPPGERSQKPFLLRTGTIPILFSTLSFAAFIVALSAYFQTSSMRSELLEQRSILLRDVAPMEQVLAMAERLSTDPRFRVGILPASPERLSFAAVTSRARNCIQNSGGSVIRTEQETAKLHGALTHFSITLEAKMAPIQFESFLEQLELGQPALLIQSIEIATGSELVPARGNGKNYLAPIQTFKLTLVGMGATADG